MKNISAFLKRFPEVGYGEGAQWRVYGALCLAVVAAYSNVSQNAFVWDDFHLIVNNSSLRHWNGLSDILTKNTLGPYYRPVQGLLYFFIYQIFGLSLAAFHAVNVVLQAANSCLMYNLGCRLGFNLRASFAAALLWGVHPLWIEVVAIVSGTSDLLAGFFCLAGLLVLLPDFKPRNVWLSIPFFILALGSKESAVVFPALASFTLFLVSRERLQPVTYFRTWPLWLLAAGYIAGLLLCPALINSLPSYMYQDSAYVELYKHNIIRILTSLATLPTYLGLMMTPANVHMAWEFPVFTTVRDWQVIGGGLIVFTALLQIIRGRELSLTWGLLWFAAALSPYTGIVKPVDGQLFEHWIYLSAAGLFLGVSQAVATRVGNKKAKLVAAGLVALAALVLGVRTYLQNEILRTENTLYENVLEYNPRSGWAHYVLGQSSLDQRDYDQAIGHFQYMIDHPDGNAKIPPFDIHWKLVMAWLHIPPAKEGAFRLETGTLQSCQRLPEVVVELGKVLQDNPDYYWAHQVLAAIYRYQGNNQMAVFHLKRAEEISQRLNEGVQHGAH